MMDREKGVVHARYVQWPRCLAECGPYTLHPCHDAGWSPTAGPDNVVLGWHRDGPLRRELGLTEFLSDLATAWSNNGPDDGYHYPAAIEVVCDDGSIVQATLGINDLDQRVCWQIVWQSVPGKAGV